MYGKENMNMNNARGSIQLFVLDFSIQTQNAVSLPYIFDKHAELLKAWLRLKLT